MSIQTDLTRLQSAKAAIKAAIEGKGVTVPEATLLDGMAALIESIKAGGGGDLDIRTGSFTPTTDISKPYTFQHSLGKIPKAVFVWVTERTDFGSDSYSILFGYAFEISVDGTPAVISTGAYSNDSSNTIIKNASISYGIAYNSGHTLETLTENVSNNTLRIYGATTEYFTLKLALSSGCFRNGWTYKWLVI